MAEKILASCHHTALYLANSDHPTLVSLSTPIIYLTLIEVWAMLIRIFILPIVTKRHMLNTRST